MGPAIARQPTRTEGLAPVVAADAAPCEDCLTEMRDPDDRRYRYPFISCANCGPRYTIVRGVPYERSRTTMASFEMCQACRAEYDDARGRRFQAQSIGCPQCGPRARLEGDLRDARNPIASAARLLIDGAIVAVKGLGGYHLAARADDPQAVCVLRARKLAESRPFALMVADVQAAEQLALVYEEEAALLRAPQRPIVLAALRTGAPVAEEVAPHTNELGLMLPHTPLHDLLIADFASLGGGALAIAEGSVGGAPLVYEDDDALARLADVADAFLVHDRPIHARAEDSLVQVVQSAPGPRQPMTLRRSRGYVPDSLRLPVPASRSLLACGADLQSTFCLARGEHAWVGPHVGDLDDEPRLQLFGEGIARFQELFAIEPEIVTHDLHPDYRSTAYAMRCVGVEPFGVQHHHAHLAAVLAEHGEVGPAVGAIYDDGGHGADGTWWGGELLVGGLEDFERVGHLRTVPLPDEGQTRSEPWRMVCAWVAEAGGASARVPAPLEDRIDPQAWEALARAVRTRQASRATSSVGLLLDGVAALCGMRSNDLAYAGRTAAELDALTGTRASAAYTVRYAQGELDPRPAILDALSDLEDGLPPRVVSARFHEALAAATVTACLDAAESAGLSLVVLAGDCFQNRLLLELVAAGVHDAGLRVLTSERLPPGDGSISFGQSAIAAVATSL